MKYLILALFLTTTANAMDLESIDDACFEGIDAFDAMEFFAPNTTDKRLAELLADNGEYLRTCTIEQHRDAVTLGK